MFFTFDAQRFMLSGRTRAEALISSLDRPSNNFDVAGVPTGRWSSGLCDWYTHCGSCFMATACPCIAFAQVAIRSQIPLFISIKNGTACLRASSGYRVLIDFYFWTLATAIACFFCVAYFSVSAFWYRRIVIYLLYIVGIASAVGFVMLNGHTRYAFREKYDLPQAIDRQGCGAINKVLEHAVGALCIPCSLSQMMRHVFQFGVWRPRIDFYVGDPSLLDPLVASEMRPERADLAGLCGEQPDPSARMYTGAGMRLSAQTSPAPGRPPASGSRLPSAIPIVASVFAGNGAAVAQDRDIIYNSDGTEAKRGGKE